MIYFTELRRRLHAIGTVAGDSPLAGRVRAAQIQAVNRYTPWMMAANILNAALVAVMFIGSPLFLQVFTWATGIFVLAILGAWKWWLRKDRPAPSTASTRAIRKGVDQAAVLGCIWALLPALFFPYANLEQQLVIACVVAGMLCGSGFALATVPPAALAFSGMLALGSMIALIAAPGFVTIILLFLNVIYVVIILVSAVALFRTLLARLEAQISSEEQRELIGVLLNDFEEHGSDWLWVTDRFGRLRHASARLAEILGASDDALVGQFTLRVAPVQGATERTPDDKRAWRMLLSAISRRQTFRDLEVPVSIGGQKRLWALTGKPSFTSTGRFDGYRGVGRDVTLASETRAKIEYMARYDALTGLANRAALNEELGRALSWLKRHGTPCTLLLIDLDHFKFVNDTQGHPVGDALLQKAAQRLTTIVDDNGFAARLGGDEFALLLAAPPAKAEHIGRMLVATMAEPFALETGEVVIGASIGIAIAERDTEADTLIRHADLALYRAKDEGRGRFVFFEPALDAAARRRQQIESDLRLALQKGGLQLHYQPLIDARTGEIVACEALMRWRHPSLGLLSPNEFIPLAEETGLIGALGSWALAEASREAMRWPEDVRVAVNLSPVQFRSPGLFVDVSKALESSGLEPARLELEITERLFLNSTGAVSSTLDALRALGVRIVLDDFGTGYSSLSYLKTYRFEKLKIDRSFVEGIESNGNNTAIVRAVIRLSHDLGMSVSVEGVETEEQLTAVRKLGCNEVQGYLISRPIEPAQLHALFAPAGRQTARRQAR